MTSQLDETAQSLREEILGGKYAKDQRLAEQSLAEDLSVSRTLARLALSELEKEGLVYRNPNRGYRVRSFTLDEVTDAILVRGELEGMAARLCAERGIEAFSRATFQSTLGQMDDLLHKKLATIESRARWIDLNSAFHTLIVEGSRNSVIASTIESLARMPLVSSRALVFDSHGDTGSLDRIRDAHADHRVIFEAIEMRQGGRAESTMREHAFKSACNKRASFASMQNSDHLAHLPGLALVNG